MLTHDNILNGGKNVLISHELKPQIKPYVFYLSTISMV